MFGDPLCCVGCPGPHCCSERLLSHLSICFLCTHCEISEHAQSLVESRDRRDVRNSFQVLVLPLLCSQLSVTDRCSEPEQYVTLP